MPEPYPLDGVKLDRSVGAAVGDASVALLPHDLRQDPLVEWLRGLGNRPEPTEDWDFDHLQRELGGAPQALAAGYALRSPVEARLSFYYNCLYLIGRPMRLAEYARESIASITDKPGVELWDKMVGLIAERAELKSSEVSNALVFVLGHANDRHAETLSNGERWFRVWQDDVDGFRRSLERAQGVLSDYFYEGGSRDKNIRLSGFKRRDDRRSDHMLLGLAPLVDSLSRPSTLLLTLEHDGVDVSGIETGHAVLTPTQVVGIYTLLQLGSGEMSGELWHDNSADWRHAIDRLSHTMYREALAPQIAREIDYLGLRYGDLDPFAKYVRRAPTEELRREIRVNRLSDGSSSPWLSWFHSQLDPLTYYVDAPALGDLADKAYLSTFVTSADATIKNKLDSRRQPGEDWRGFITRLFEDEWLSRLARPMAREPTPWTLESFISLVMAVVGELEARGYDLDIGKDAIHRAWRKGS